MTASSLKSRQGALKNLFRLYKQAGLVEPNEWHLFCVFAKPHSIEVLQCLLAREDEANRLLLKAENLYGG